jgi:hypothetical protein
VSTIKSSAENLTLNADGSNNDIILQSNGSTKATLVGEGNLGLGVTPEAWNASHTALQVGAGSALSGDTTISRAHWTNACYQSGTSHTTGWNYQDSASGVTGLSVNDGKFEFRVAASGSADAAITWITGFEVLADGKARAKNGLLFGTDTAAANALDDYEEGTWTPAWNSGANGRSISGVGGYTKVGNLVTVFGYFEIGGSVDTGSGDVSFSGLPFTSADVSAQRSAITIHVNKCASAVDGYISGFVYHNSQNFYVREGGIVADGGDLGNHFDQDTDFYMSASYRI